MSQTDFQKRIERLADRNEPAGPPTAPRHVSAPEPLGDYEEGGPISNLLLWAVFLGLAFALYVDFWGNLPLTILIVVVMLIYRILRSAYLYLVGGRRKESGHPVWTLLESFVPW